MGRTAHSAAERVARTNTTKLNQQSDLVPFDVSPPSWLGEDAIEVWNEIVPTLATQRQLMAMDAQTLAAYCTTFAAWRLAAKQVETDGQMVPNVIGNMVLNPQARYATSLLAELRKLAVEFGLSIASRGKINVAQQSTVHDDELDAFMKGSDNGKV